VREIPRGRQVHRAGTHRGDASFGSRSISFRVLTRAAQENQNRRLGVSGEGRADIGSHRSDMTTPAGPYGLARGLTTYGDADFALYLRRSFVPGLDKGDLSTDLKCETQA